MEIEGRRQALPRVARTQIDQLLGRGRNRVAIAFQGNCRVAEGLVLREVDEAGAGGHGVARKGPPWQQARSALCFQPSVLAAVGVAGAGHPERIDAPDRHNFVLELHPEAVDREAVAGALQGGAGLYIHKLLGLDERLVVVVGAVGALLEPGRGPCWPLPPVVELRPPGLAVGPGHTRVGTQGLVGGKGGAKPWIDEEVGGRKRVRLHVLTAERLLVVRSDTGVR